jgi:hypothetical protein
MSDVDYDDENGSETGSSAFSEENDSVITHKLATIPCGIKAGIQRRG